MQPLKEKSGSVYVTRSSGRTPKGPPPYQEENASAPGRSTRSSVSRKRKAPVEPESESDFIEDVDVEEVDDKESDFEPEEASDEHELLDSLFEFDEEEPEEDNPEVEVEIDDSDVDDDETTALPFDTLGGPSGYEPSLDNITRYRGLFKATVEALKEASSTIIKESGGVQSMYTLDKTEPHPIHPGWVIKFIQCNPDMLTDRAIEDVPVETRSILGDPGLNSENWATKFRNLTKISKDAREFYAGEYIDIVDRLWLVEDAELHSGEVQREESRMLNTKMVWGRLARKLAAENSEYDHTNESMEDAFLRTYLLGETDEILEKLRPDYKVDLSRLKVWRLLTFGQGCSSQLVFPAIGCVVVLGMLAAGPLLHILYLCGYRFASSPSQYNEYETRRRLSAERGLFCGTDGLIGLAPRWALPGDKIFILQGGKVPVILRRTRHDSPYQFIGEAYVHGAMHGEMFDLQNFMSLLPFADSKPRLVHHCMDSQLQTDAAQPANAGSGLQHLHAACNSCKGRKVRCSGERPSCLSCSKYGRDCVYMPLRPRGRKRRRGIEDHVVGPARDGGHIITNTDTNTNSQDSAPVTTHGQPQATQSRTRTPCPGPLAAKRHRELRSGMGICQASTGAFQFYGPASNLAFFQSFYQRIHHNADGPTSNNPAAAMHIWGLDKFVFSPEPPELRDEANALHAFLPRDMGDCFLMTYFKVCHPQFPFLVRDEIERAWDNLWEPPQQPWATTQMCQGNRLTERNIVLMVLAIGAIMASLSPGKDAKVLERWAWHLSSRVQLRGHSFEDTSLGGVHLLLLKSIFGIQLMRPNEAHLYASHAAVNALALGMNRAQVANGPRPEMHRLRVTFWSLYANERLVTLCFGRPSCLREDLIDVALPEDLPSSEPDENTNLVFVRAMATLAKTADRISTGIYCAIGGSDAATIDRTAQECDAELDEVTRSLPPFLHFFDATMPPSRHAWQEIQRTHLGLAYYHCRILIHRPLACFASMHATNAEAAAEAATLGIADLQGSIARAMEASEALIGLALEAFTVRVPDMHQDAGVAYNVMGACLTLLYRVLDGPARTSAADAATIFNLVQDGIRCLDLMNHHGPRFSKMTLSERILTAAKDAFWSAREEGGGGGGGGTARASRGQPSAESQELDGEGNVDGVGPAPEMDVQGTAHENLDILLTQFPWLETAPPDQTTDDMSPAFPARTDGTPAAADGMSSQNAYPTLFRTAPSSARTLPTALYGFGSHPWPGVMGGDLDGGHENSMNGISWDLM